MSLCVIGYMFVMYVPVGYVFEHKSLHVSGL